MILLFAIMLGVICFDQLTKWLAVIFLQGGPSFSIWKDVFHFTYVENTGMAWGMFKDARWVFMIFSPIAIIALLVYLIRYRPKNRWMQVGISMIIGGGIGNMIDRIWLGYVVDFIDVRLIGSIGRMLDRILPEFVTDLIDLTRMDFPVFNVADSFVCIGAGILIVCLMLDLIADIRRERAEKRQENIPLDALSETDGTAVSEPSGESDSSQEVCEDEKNRER